MRHTVTALCLFILCSGIGMSCAQQKKAPHRHGSGHSQTHEGEHAQGTGNKHEGGHKHHIKRSPEEWAKRLDHPGRDKWQKPAEVIDAMAIAPGQVVADIGAGTGYFLKYLSRAVGAEGRVYALDVEDDLVQHMADRAKKERLPNVAARKCPFDSSGLPPASVDRILIVNTWHHIRGRVDYTRKLMPVLREGGVLFVVDFNKTSTVGPPTSEKLESRQIVAELERGGMQVELMKESLPEQYIIRATAP